MNGSELIDCFPDFSTTRFINVGVARGVSSAASILMCCIALLLVLILKRWTVFSQKLTIYLLMSALFSSVGQLVSIDYNHGHSLDLSGLCAFTGFVWQVTVWMLQDAIFAITIYLFFLIVLDFNTDEYHWLYVIGIFGSPFFFNWLPFVRSSYGRSGAWCWIREINEITCEIDSFGRTLQYCLYYGPVYFLLIIGAILYVIIFINISRKQRKRAWVDSYQTQRKLKNMKTELLSLIAYPVIFAVLNIPSIVNRTLFLVHPDQPILAAWYLAAIVSPMHGGFTALTFVFITKDWRHISCIRLGALFKRDKLVEQYTFGDTPESESYEGPQQSYTPFTP